MRFGAWRQNFQNRIGSCHTEELITGRHQTGVPQTAPIQQLKVKPFGLTQFHHGRRRKGEYHGVADSGEGSHGPTSHGRDSQLGAIAQIPILEFRKGQS